MLRLYVLLSIVAGKSLNHCVQRECLPLVSRSQSSYLQNNSQPWRRAVSVLLIIFLVANPIFAAPGMPVILAIMANELK